MRTFCVIGAFAVLSILWPETLLRLPLNMLLAIGGGWAIRIGEAGGGSSFLRNDSFTKFLAVPMMLGIALTLLDAWSLLRR